MLKRKTGVFVGIWAVASLAMGCGGLQSYHSTPDVDAGDAAGAIGTIEGDSGDIQQAAIAMGALLTEIISNRDVRIMLGTNGEGFADSTCMTSTSLGIVVVLNFDACAEGSGQVVVSSNPILGGTMLQLDGENGFTYKGMAVTGTLSVTAVEGEPMTWGLVSGDAINGTAPLAMTLPSGTVLQLTPDVVGSLHAAGPTIYFWGTEATMDATLSLGEVGASGIMDNPPGWDAPLSACACPTIGETNMDATLSVDSLVVDLDLLTDGDGIGDDDFPPFTMPIAPQTASGTMRAEFLETCGDMTTEFSTEDTFNVVVAKADIMAAIDADTTLTDDQRASIHDGAKDNLRDEITLHVRKDVLGSAAQGAAGLDGAFCTSF